MAIKRHSTLTRRSRGRTAQDYTIIIAYDGARTEDEYFRGWQLVIPRSRLSIQPLYVKSGGNPLHAVRAASKKKLQLSDFAEFWCVCDVDDTCLEDIAQARKEAEDAGIRLCLSERCFEIWIALHFTRCAKPVRTEDEAIELVREHIPNYGVKGKSAPFAQLLPLTDDAIANARWLAERGCANPSTNVHSLVNKLLQNQPR